MSLDDLGCCRELLLLWQCFDGMTRMGENLLPRNVWMREKKRLLPELDRELLGRCDLPARICGRRSLGLPQRFAERDCRRARLSNVELLYGSCGCNIRLADLRTLSRAVRDCLGILGVALLRRPRLRLRAFRRDPSNRGLFLTC